MFPEYFAWYEINFPKGMKRMDVLHLLCFYIHTVKETLMISKVFKKRNYFRKGIVGATSWVLREQSATQSFCFMKEFQISRNSILLLDMSLWVIKPKKDFETMFWDLGFMLGYFSWCSGSTTWGAGTLAPLALDSTCVEDVVLLVVYDDVLVVSRALAARMNVPHTVSATGACALAMC